ncbi:MAG: DUF4442 domain-containing protein [Candidatus Marinimicrobia bacterium]|nr:DUF4442 domain-containing protein [Candidatus Neomarinimicrobiota bacterium]
MIFNPAKYFIKRYHSPDLKPSELKIMLNLWMPFIFNRVKIEEISDDFTEIKIRLIHSIWNRNPNKALWGGAIFSAADGFFPIILKQSALRNGIKTDFFTKSTTVKYIREAKTDLTFHFKVMKDEIENFFNILKRDGKYQEWHTIDGIDTHGKKCIEVKIQPYLRIRN